MRELGGGVVTLRGVEKVLGEAQVGVIDNGLHLGAHPHRLRELLREALAPPPLRHRDFGEDHRGFSELAAQARVEGDRPRLFRRSLRFRDVAPIHVHQGPREQRMRALGLGGLRRALRGEYVFIEGDRGGIRPDAEVVPKGLSQPLEAPDSFPTLSGVEMSPHQRPCRLLVGGVLLGQPIPVRCGAQHVQVAPVQAAARLGRPGLVSIVR